MSKDITIFWSWQSDSPNATNRGFIEKCIDSAIKNLTKNTAKIIKVERGVDGKGGTPDIANTVLKRISDADIFIWDATLCYSKPRPAPNPNVLFEMGYANSILGDGRIIGIMNISNGYDGRYLPFDLKYKRWPITYSLKKPNKITKYINIIKNRNSINKKKIKDELIKKIENAIKEAINEPKQNAFQSDVDYCIAKTFWDIIDSNFIVNWCKWRKTYIQYEKKENMGIFDSYIDVWELPENKYVNEILKVAHDKFIKEVINYRNVKYSEMTSMNPETYVITTKALRVEIENYDEKYEAQCDKLEIAIDSVKATWDKYVSIINTYYPDIVRSNKQFVSTNNEELYAEI